MQPRMKQPVFVIPEAMTALRAFSKAAETSGVPATTIALVHIRACQINVCAVCLYLHTRPEFFAKDTDARVLTGTASAVSFPFTSQKNKRGHHDRKGTKKRSRSRV